MGLDSFVGAEGADGAISAEKVREFQARMSQNAKHMAAARKQEKKQKKKEDKLVAILLRFIQTNTRSDITTLVSRCLEQNIPAVFILTIILLGNEDIQKEMGIHLQLDGADEKEEERVARFEDLQGEGMKGALVAFGKNSALPLKIRIAIDLWGRSMWDAVEPIPERILKTAVEFDEDPKANPKPKPVVVQLAGFVLRDYFGACEFKQSYENVKGFAEFLIRGLMKRLKDQLEDQKQLGGKEGG